MYGWSSRQDLRNVGAWDQFGKDMDQILGRKTLVQDILAFVIAVVPALVGGILLIKAFLFVASEL